MLTEPRETLPQVPSPPRESEANTLHARAANRNQSSPPPAASPTLSEEPSSIFNFGDSIPPLGEARAILKQSSEPNNNNTERAKVEKALRQAPEKMQQAHSMHEENMESTKIELAKLRVAEDDLTTQITIHQVKLFNCESEETTLVDEVRIAKERLQRIQKSKPKEMRKNPAAPISYFNLFML